VSEIPMYFLSALRELRGEDNLQVFHLDIENTPMPQAMRVNF